MILSYVGFLILVCCLLILYSLLLFVITINIVIIGHILNIFKSTNSVGKKLLNYSEYILDHFNKLQHFSLKFSKYMGDVGYAIKPFK